MNATTASPGYSSEFREVITLFKHLHKPYGKNEIVRFNRTYERIYPHLSQGEKRRAERLVDALIKNLENENLAAYIYGVF